VAVVTGGSRGIGAAIAAELVAAGFAVASLSRSADSPQGVLGVACDVSDRQSVERAFELVERQLGAPTVVVANAGITRDRTAARMSPSEWDEVIATNLTGAFHTAQRAIPGMVEAGWGRLVFTGSMVGTSGGFGQANYAAAKAGLVGLAKSLAKELGPKGITSNVVAPGYIDTDMTADIPQQVKAKWLAQLPAGRAGTPEEVAGLVAYLCSDRAAYINGAVIPIDGGIGV
jgi:3-oxoacyl-[acyl-carrier protein] reductase